MSLSEMEVARLRWACRRGMLELDLLLLPFFERQFSQLSENEQTVFIELLYCTDQELYDWLVKQNIPDDSPFCHLTQCIIKYARLLN